MKKFTLTVMIALFIVGGAKAQLGYGLKAGLNFPSYNIENSDSETNSTTNFYVTGYLDAPVANNVLSSRVSLCKVKELSLSQPAGEMKMRKLTKKLCGW